MRETAFAKASVPARAHGLPGRHFTDGAVFAQERERILASEWICVGREEHVGQPGDFFLADVAGESLIVVRGDDRQVRAFFNVCRHRGTRLCSDERGTLTGSIQCPYHAWTYALDGRLLAAHNMADVAGFDQTEYPLHQAALAVWNGFLFLNLAQKAEPFSQAFAPVAQRFARWHIGELRAARRIEYEVAANWKLVFQNYSECYHCPLIHPALEKLTPSDSGRNDLMEGAFLGGYMTFRRPGGTLTTSGATARRAVGEVGGDDLNRVYFYAIFPSLLLSLHPDYVMAHIVRPVNVAQTTIACEWLFDPSEIRRADFDPSDAVEFWDLTNRQDWRVCELSQLGVSSRAYVPGPYANQEGLLHAFDRHYLSKIDAPD